MRLGHHPHLTRQYRTQLLQSVAFTPGTGKTHLAIGIAIRACQAGHRVLFATASQWVARLAEAHHSGRLQQELIRLGRYPLIVVIDEVGYIPFEPEAANLFFQLVSSRYERASLIVTSNKPFGKAHLFVRTCAEVAETSLVPNVSSGCSWRWRDKGRSRCFRISELQGPYDRRMTTFALVHGAWCGLWCWELLTPLLQQEGHDVVAMDLPCDEASASFETYADAVCAALDGCDHDVVLVGHSLGANTIPLVAARRPVRHSVYLCGVVPAIGRSVFDQIAGADMMLPGWDAGLSEPDAESRTTWVDLDHAHTAVCRL